VDVVVLAVLCRCLRLCKQTMRSPGDWAVLVLPWLRVVRTQRCAKREARKRFAVHRSVGGLKTECERVAQNITSVQVFYVQYVPSVESSRCVEGKKEKD